MTAIPLDSIRRDNHIQQRVGGLQTPRVREYAKAMREDANFPPIVVYYDGQDYWLADGFHRVAAAEEAKRKKIEADIHPGTYRDAILHAVGANAAHGIRRTNADKRKAVLTLLQDREWRQWSDHELARVTHTTQPFVSKVRHQALDGDTSTLRKGADGRIINTGNIGRNLPLQRLEQAWERASASERQQWLEGHQEEILALRRS